MRPSASFSSTSGDFVLHPDADPALAAEQLRAWAPLLAFLRHLGPEAPVARPLQEVQMPWELTEGLRAQLIALSPAQLTVVVQAITNLGSVSLGMLLAQQGIEPEKALAALTATADYAMRRAGGVDADHELFTAAVRQIVQRMLLYVRLHSS